MVDTKMKNILYVEQNQDGTIGGSHHSLFYMVKALDKSKYNAIVGFYERLPVFDRFNLKGVHPVILRKPLGKKFAAPLAILTIPCTVFRKLYNFITVCILPFFRFLFFLVKYKIDLVHINNSSNSGREWLLACKLLRRKCINHERGFASFTRLSGRIARYFDVIVCISKSVENHLKRSGISNTKVIYNAIDVDEFRSRITRTPSTIRDEFSIKDGAPLLGLVANFQEWKGHHIVVEAVNLLRNWYPDISCLFVGSVSKSVIRDKQYFEKIKKMIIKNGLTKNIIMTGYRADVADLINAFDILLHSSVEPEPFGRVIIEGMSLMKPVIATDMGGAAEIIENGVSGLLVPPRNPEALVENVMLLLENPELRQEIGRRAMMRVKEKFGFAKLSEDINELYGRLLGF